MFSLKLWLMLYFSAFLDSVNPAYPKLELPQTT